MTKRTTLLVLDTSMLAFFAVLMSWRMTGLVLHEWIGLVLIAMIVVHLLVHWGWVETRVGALVKRHRRFGALLLNAALFVAMGAALVSGLVISKVIFPNALSGSAYLTWHSLHEDASNFSMLLVALHAAYNWDRIKGSLRHAFTRLRAVPARALRWSDIDLAVTARRLGWIAGLSAVLTLGVFADARSSHGERDITIQYANGRRERVPAPRSLAERRAEYDWPRLGQGAAWKFAMAGTVMVFFSLVGRAVMLRFVQRRRGRRGPSVSGAEPSGASA